ncbi:hypothetical protein [cf. Phormidesmis sp. LEGE 11477]|uniref:hypothetical protein n=1 Tax=cf. Phormidesmis sp. LEGE 11477 TaxID=1828680 RepID=UPI001881C832|nr:hypothetical protein [cf. Phormidesmis sp. LEGE 11477]MBE9061169.1 hypothetical protein [cf. Phormidesmis sp. LEGE 11477]
MGRSSLEEGEQPPILELQVFTDYSVVTVTNEGFVDDAIAAKRDRLEFEKVDEQRWQIVWAGDQQRCRRGRDLEEWTTQLCP